MYLTLRWITLGKQANKLDICAYFWNIKYMKIFGPTQLN